MSADTASSDLGFIHRWLPGNNPDLTLLLLHGTGGNESDLLPLGRMLSLGVSLLSPRGKVLENGLPRFFRRLAEGVFDREEVRERAAELAAFLRRAAEKYGFDLQTLIAVGYSNGANIAAATMLTHPNVIGGAVLFRPMLPLTPEAPPDLKSVPVFISSGEHDPLMPKASVTSLVELLKESGSSVSLYWQDAGHELTDTELREAKQWLDELVARHAA
jgi:predicted esterase